MIIAHLDPEYYDRAAFACAEPSLNLFLHAYARQFQTRGLGVTWVATTPEKPRTIIGYYTLAMNSVLSAELDDPKIRVQRIPVVLLGRLAIASIYQGKGYGAQLLMHALYSSYELSTRIGTHAVIVDPINEGAAKFYQKFDFIPMPGAPEKMYLSMKFLAKSLGKN